MRSLSSFPGPGSFTMRLAVLAGVITGVLGLVALIAWAISAGAGSSARDDRALLDALATTPRAYLSDLPATPARVLLEAETTGGWAGPVSGQMLAWWHVERTRHSEEYDSFDEDWDSRSSTLEERSSSDTLLVRQAEGGPIAALAYSGQGARFITESRRDISGSFSFLSSKRNEYELRTETGVRVGVPVVAIGTVTRGKGRATMNPDTVRTGTTLPSSPRRPRTASARWSRLPALQAVWRVEADGVHSSPASSLSLSLSSPRRAGR